MNFDHILAISKPDYSSLRAFGFPEENGTFTLSRPLSESGFTAKITIDGRHIEAVAFDGETGENYALLDVARAHGAFVTSLREEIRSLIGEIRAACFTGNDIRKKVRGFPLRTFCCSW